MSPTTDPPPTEFESAEIPADAGVVCPTCVTVNPFGTDYCTRCASPLNSLTTFNPFGQTLAEGFAYRRAVDGPPSRIVLAGIWLLFGPMMAFLPILIADLFHLNDGHDAPPNLAAHTAYGIYALVGSVIIYRATANYLRKRRAAITVEPAAE